MNIIEKLKKSVESVGVQFYYHSAETLNRLLDDADFPCAFAVLASQGAIADVNGQYHERLTVVISFADMTEFDFDALENEAIIDRCKRKALAWLTSMRTNEDLRLISVNSTTRDYAEFDIILTGYGLNVTIEEVEGYGVCDFADR